MELRAGRCGSGCGDADMAYGCRAGLGSHGYWLARELKLFLPQLVTEDVEATRLERIKAKELNDAVVDGASSVEDWDEFVKSFNELRPSPMLNTILV